MKAFLLAGLGILAGCATHPVAPVSQTGYGYEPSYSSDEVLAREQAEINQEAQAAAERSQLNRIDQQQLQTQQQQQREEEHQQLQPYGTPTYSQ